MAYNTLQKGRITWWIPAWLIVYNVAANLSNDLYLPCLASLGKIFSTHTKTVQLTMTAWYLGVALPQFLFGLCSDRWGRRPLLVGGGLCFMVATLVGAYAPNITVLIVARFFQGVGVCSLNVTTYSVVPELYPLRKRVQVIAYLTLCGYLSPILGPTIGGYILVAFDWHINFILLFGLLLLSVAGLCWVLPETHAARDQERVGWLKKCQSYGVLWRNKVLFSYWILWCAVNCGLVVYLTSSPFVVIEQLRVKTQHYGLVQLVIFTAGALGSLWLNHRTRSGRFDKVARNRLMKLGLLLISLACGFNIMAAIFFGSHLSMYIAPMALYTFGLGLCGSLFISEIMTLAEGQQGIAAALIGFGTATSGALASYLVTLFYHYGNLALVITIGGIIVTAYVCSLFLYRSHLKTRVNIMAR